MRKLRRLVRPGYRATALAASDGAFAISPGGNSGRPLQQATLPNAGEAAFRATHPYALELLKRARPLSGNDYRCATLVSALLAEIDMRSHALQSSRGSSLPRYAGGGEPTRMSGRGASSEGSSCCALSGPR